jgi:hypothetical protein
VIAEEDRCSADVHDGGRWPSHRCSRRAVNDGYCRQHHPDAVAARQYAADERYREKWDNSPQMKLARANERIAELERRIAILEGKKELRFLGVANGWKETPEAVLRCNHERTRTDVEIADQYYVVQCEECGYRFEYDCSG